MQSRSTPRPWPKPPPERYKIFVDDLERAYECKWTLENKAKTIDYPAEYFHDMPLNQVWAYVKKGLYRKEK